MGQYYRIYFEKNDGSCDVWRPNVAEKNFNGHKLMEFSWCGDLFADSIVMAVYRNPMRVATIGDYALEGNEQLIGKAYKRAWNSDISHGIHAFTTSLDDRYVVNHTKKIFVDFNEYKENSKTESGRVIHPIPLLTVAGNGRGGGDYCGSCMEEVGTWCMDVISVEDFPPDEYEKISVQFVERD